MILIFPRFSIHNIPVWEWKMFNSFERCYLVSICDILCKICVIRKDNFTCLETNVKQIIHVLNNQQWSKNKSLWYLATCIRCYPCPIRPRVTYMWYTKHAFKCFLKAHEDKKWGYIYSELLLFYVLCDYVADVNTNKYSICNVKQSV